MSWRDDRFVTADGYLSGSPILGTATFEDHTFESLGLNLGTYTWSWTATGGGDSITLDIIPEPSTLILLLTAALGLLLHTRRKR